MHHRAHLLRREVDVRLAIVARDEAMPVTVAFDEAFGFAEEPAGPGCGLQG